MTKTEALRMALEVATIRWNSPSAERSYADKMVIDAIEEALAQPEQEPLTDEQVDLIAHNTDLGDWNSLYCQDAWHLGFREGFREAEKEHKIKGNHK